MFNLGVPFFLPVWRRIATVFVAVGWGLFEFSQGSSGWALIFCGLGSVAAWQFHVTDWDAVRAAAATDPNETPDA